MDNKKFKLLKVFQKELSYKTFDDFNDVSNLMAGINLDVDAINLDKNVYLSSLKILFSAKSGEKGEKNVFEIALTLCGIFAYDSQSEDDVLKDEDVKYAVQVRFPTILFPFARQIISQTALNGGFPNVLLDIIDFENLPKVENKNTVQ